MRREESGTLFRPAPLLGNPHVQTIAGRILNGVSAPLGSQRVKVDLEDDNYLLLHDDRPPQWQAGDPTALLMHGLGGCSRSAYLLRIGALLNTRGWRVFRIDMRNTGDALGSSRVPYHSGRSGDVLASLGKIEELCPGSPIVAAGFSLSGNMLLRMLGAHAGELPETLKRAIAVCPPIDLNASIELLSLPRNRLYDLYYLRMMLKQVRESRALRRGRPGGYFKSIPRSVYEYDEAYTGHVSGFRDARDYYTQASAAPWLDRIEIPTQILYAKDDPFVSARSIESAPRNGAVRLLATDGGGHMGFLGRAEGAPNWRWMDWQVVNWLSHDFNGDRNCGALVWLKGSCIAVK